MRTRLLLHAVTVLTTLILLPLRGEALPPQELPRADRSVRVQPIVDTLRAALGEGAIWHPSRKTLFWVDLTGQRLYELVPSERHCHRWDFDAPVSTVVPESDSTVVIALADHLERFNLRSQHRDTLALIPDRGGRLRCNDGKCDPAGRLWIGTMAYDGNPEEGTLYSVEPSGEISVQIGSVSISNGIVWSADRSTMYYIDTPTRQVCRYRYDEASGRISFEEVSIIVPEAWGSPDGMTIDRNGKLWIAHWGGEGVYQWDPDSGELIRRIAVPVPNVTSCAFGGENLDTLYITTAACSPADSTRYPLSGNLFVCKPGVKGVKAHFFGKKN